MRARQTTITFDGGYICRELGFLGNLRLLHWFWLDWPDEQSTKTRGVNGINHDVVRVDGTCDSVVCVVIHKGTECMCKGNQWVHDEIEYVTAITIVTIYGLC